MKKKTVFVFLFLSLVFWGIGFVFINNHEFGLCYFNLNTNTFDVSCGYKYWNVGLPLFYSMPALAFTFLILLFLPQAIPAWKKFAKWFIPLATLLFIFYGDPGSGDLFAPYPEQIFRWVSIFYVVVSIVIILWITIKEKNNNNLDIELK